MKKTKRIVTALASLVAMFLLLPAAPAQAYESKTPFLIEYGNSQLKGTLTWYARSVKFEGVNAVASGAGCRQGQWRAGNGVLHDYGHTSLRCVAGAWPFEGTLTIDTAGGVEFVDIIYYDDTEKLLGDPLHCTPQGCRQ